MKAFQVWQEALGLAYFEGVKFVDSSGLVVFEKENLCLNFESKDVMMPYRFLMGKDKWIFPSVNELKTILFSKEASIFYDYNLGNRIFKHSGKIDQMKEYVLPMLAKSPASRRIYVGIYNPLIDSKLDGRDVPGIIGISFKVRNNALYATAILRSTDLFLGWPANALQLSFLQNFLCENSGFDKGELSTVSLNAHLFEDNLDDCQFALYNKNG